MNKNSKLQNLISLACSVRVYVPSTVDTDTEADTTLHREQVERALARWFGGATSYNALGCWVSPTAGLVREQVTIVEAHTDTAGLEAWTNSVVELAETLKRELRQDAVAIEINGNLYLV